MMERLNQWAAWFEARNMRERVLIAATTLALTYGVWLTFIGDTVIDAEAEVIRNIERLASDLKTQGAERQRLAQMDHTETLRELNERKEELEEMLASQAAALELALGGFIAPADMPELLQTILKRQGDLKLVSMRTQDPIELGSEATPIFVHPLAVRVEGRFFDVLAYLEALENAPWQLKWRSLEYAVEEHPTAEVLIEVETLSRDREWLGV